MSAVVKFGRRPTGKEWATIAETLSFTVTAEQLKSHWCNNMTATPGTHAAVIEQHHMQKHQT